MNWFLRILFVLATYLVSIASAHAEESPYSINLFGFSWHEDGSQRKSAHQENPGIGLRYDISRTFYVEGNHIWKNSVKGATDTIGIGFHAELAKSGDRSLKVGVQVMRMHYQFPTKRDRSGYIPALTVEYSLTSKAEIVTYFFPKKKESVAIIGLNIRF